MFVLKNIYQKKTFERVKKPSEGDVSRRISIQKIAKSI